MVQSKLLTEELTEMERTVDLVRGEGCRRGK